MRRICIELLPERNGDRTRYFHCSERIADNNSLINLDMARQFRNFARLSELDRTVMEAIYSIPEVHEAAIAGNTASVTREFAHDWADFEHKVINELIRAMNNRLLEGVVVERYESSYV